MATSEQARLGPVEFTVALSPIDAAHLRSIADAWGLTPEQALVGLLEHQINQCSAAVADLPPVSVRGLH